jgi:nicotinamidase-related amidase
MEIMRDASVFARRLAGVVAACTVFAAAAPPVGAQTVVDEWSTVKAPGPIALQPVTVDPKTTAVLLLDFVKQTCNEQRRPRCLASLPAVAKLLGAARSSGATVIYSIVTTGTVADIMPPVARNANEPYVQAGPDKFIGTDLQKLLTDKGIKTVIVSGTTAEGAVMNTANHAAQLGYDVIVPVDGMSSSTLYAEQYVAWNTLNAPTISAKAKATTIARISF